MTINNITAKEKEIELLICTALSDLGYHIVRIKLIEASTKTLQIMIEKKDQQMVVVKDCAIASRAISAILEIADPIAEKYHLEVSSTGIDRPLMTLEDFVKFKEHQIKIHTKNSVGKKKNFKGKILQVNNNLVTLFLEDEQYLEIDFDEIMTAKLILDNELLARANNN